MCGSSDVMHAAGCGTERLELRDRKVVLRRLLSFGGRLRFCQHRNTDGHAYWRQACQRGWEGVIAKRADAPYRPGRSRDWLKFKCENAQEFVIGGYTEPQGSRTGFGAVLLGYYDNGRFVYAGKVGTGFDEDMLAELGRELDDLERDDAPYDRGRLPRAGVRGALGEAAAGGAGGVHRVDPG